jgi:hypothetical protein
MGGAMANYRLAVECLGKFKHTNKRDADKQARRQAFLASYRCSQCGFWHVGKRLARRGKPERD